MNLLVPKCLMESGNPEFELLKDHCVPLFYLVGLFSFACEFLVLLSSPLSQARSLGDQFPPEAKFDNSGCVPQKDNFLLV